MKDFFKRSDFLDWMVLRPLSHITMNWELSWDYDNDCYAEEDESFAKLLNQLILQLENIEPPKDYHKNEDELVKYVIESLHWDMKKVGKRWVGQSYTWSVEQGGHGDYNQSNLLHSAAGRIAAAISYGQHTFDEMEEGHQKILAYILTTILYHRWSGEWDDEEITD